MNALIMGLFALSFSQGPYSSRGQELWYRYGSLGFLLGGAIIPAIALLSGARRPAWLTTSLTTWMFLALFAFLFYAMLSSGGV
jgi:hypothetical protein